MLENVPMQGIGFPYLDGVHQMDAKSHPSIFPSDLPHEGTKARGNEGAQTYQRIPKLPHEGMKARFLGKLVLRWT
jgi:hypothetical protein